MKDGFVFGDYPLISGIKKVLVALVARGGLIEIDKQTKDFLVLTEANIRVQNSRITEISQVSSIYPPTLADLKTNSAD